MKHKPTETPWGPSQSEREFAPGIVFYSTASHGGYHLSTVERWREFTAIPQFANVSRVMVAIEGWRPDPLLFDS